MGTNRIECFDCPGVIEAGGHRLHTLYYTMVSMSVSTYVLYKLSFFWVKYFLCECVLL